MYTCMDPGIFAGGSRGGGVQVQLPDNSSDVFLCFFLVLNLFYSFTEGVQKKTKFSKVSEGSNIFQGGGGPNASFYRNRLSPLWIHAWYTSLCLNPLKT